jgi:hypothetical protein
MIRNFFVVPLAHRAMCYFVSVLCGSPINPALGFEVKKTGANNTLVFFGVSVLTFQANIKSGVCRFPVYLFLNDHF